MTTSSLMQPMVAAIEEELHRAVDRAGGRNLETYRAMMAYHLGWEGEGAGLEARGKRIRPLLVLLTNAAAGGDWQKALPAAASAELVHNFSLIHDDIQDNSPLRRGRPTVWKRWGVPQAINCGDGMLTLAHLSALRLAETLSEEMAFQAVSVLLQACLELTHGQFLDLSYEAYGNLSLDAYWSMVSGKTAALLAACTELGALTAGAPQARCAAYRRFGHFLGLAFQAQDDILGIWGDAAQTGKSSESDLLAGKKSLPVLFGLAQGGPFARRWSEGAIRQEEVHSLSAQLEAEGARAYAQEHANRLTRQALEALQEAGPQGEAGEALVELAGRLLNRDS